MRIKEIWIGQYRYLGNDDWTNNTVVGFSEDDVKRQILAELNEDVRDANKDAAEFQTGEGPWPEYTSLDDASDQNAGELFYEVWCNDRDVEVPPNATA